MAKKKKKKAVVSSPVALVQKLGDVIERIEAELGDLVPTSSEARELRKKRTKLKQLSQKITGAVFKRNTIVYKQAAENLENVTKESKKAIKNLEEHAAVLRVLSKLVLAAEQLILTAL